MSSLIEMTCLLAFLMSTCKYNTNENVRIRDREKHHDLRYKTYLESSREYSLHRSRNVGRSRRWRKRWSDRLDTSTKVHYWSKYRFKNEFREAKLTFFYLSLHRFLRSFWRQTQLRDLLQQIIDAFSSQLTTGRSTRRRHIWQETFKTWAPCSSNNQYPRNSTDLLFHSHSLHTVHATQPLNRATLKQLSQFHEPCSLPFPEGGRAMNSGDVARSCK